ncbi:MAG: V-type ATP synthase subunit A [Clostridiales bacterium]|nr:V-type ATP synthase subunit A [Clostridiales bacterium]
MDNKSLFIRGINGPVVTVSGDYSLSMLNMVYVGDERLFGEVVGVKSDHAIVQVYEDTSGLKPGEPVYDTGAPMSVKLGPGLMSNIYDGIARPLSAIEKQSGVFIARGLNISSLDPDRVFNVEIKVKNGDRLNGGDIYAETMESELILHKVLLSPQLSGTVQNVKPSGSYKVDDTIAELVSDTGTMTPLTLCQLWPIRMPRPYKTRLPMIRPLITGQRIIDTLFPVAKGGCAAVPGPFGAGKTITQHQLAKWSDADIIIYIGCGERGNEMTEVLEEFSKLLDPKSNKPMLDRTILIANTSNMPVAAREASIYTGITMAEYYRDMGYHVAILADSTSRWAEALREISGRLEEMPAEEGYPAYLPSRLAEFYERAGYMQGLNDTEGSVTIIGAISPQGGDFSEPVTQNTKRFIRTFWALDRSLAYARHFPAINWITSYTEYFSMLDSWYENSFGPDFSIYRSKIASLLQEESKLLEIVKLIGSDVLPDDQKLIVESARVIRLGFLQQNAYNDTDTYVPIEKQLKMMMVMIHLYEKSKEVIAKNIPVSRIKDTGLFDELIRIKYDIPNDNLSLLDDMKKKINEKLDELIKNNS